VCVSCVFVCVYVCVCVWCVCKNRRRKDWPRDVVFSYMLLDAAADVFVLVG